MKAQTFVNHHQINFIFLTSQNSNHNVDNDVESNDSQVNLKDVDDNGDG